MQQECLTTVLSLLADEVAESLHDGDMYVYLKSHLDCLKVSCF